MLKGYKYEIFPTEYQKEVLSNLFGLNRLVWNLNLSKWIQNYEDRKNKKIDEKDYYKIQNYKPILSSYEKSEEVLEALKLYGAGGWIASSSQNLSKALNNKFSKTRKTNTGFPKFKSKHKRQSITNCMCSPKFRKGNEILITKNLGWIKFDNHRFCEGKITGTTNISFENDKYYVSIQVETKPQKKNDNNKVVGIDWNCRDDAWLTLSDGRKIKCPRFMLAAQKQLKRAQRVLSRRFQQGVEVQSNNYYKQKHKVSKLYRKVANQRKDFIWKLAKELCGKYQTIVFEDINLQTMARTYKHNGLNHGKIIADQGFGLLRTLCEYFGNVKYVPSAYTSKKCNACGEIADFVRVGVEEWVCPKCGVEHDRDENAAKNILAIYEGRVGTSRTNTLAKSDPQGPHKSRKTKTQENSKTISELRGSE